MHFHSRRTEAAYLTFSAYLQLLNHIKYNSFNLLNTFEINKHAIINVVKSFIVHPNTL